MSDAEFAELWTLAVEYWPRITTMQRQQVTLARRFRHIDLRFAKMACDDAGISGRATPPWEDILRRAREMQNDDKRDSVKQPDGEFDEYAMLPPRLRELAELKRHNPGRRVRMSCLQSGETFGVECTRHRTDGYAAQVQIRSIETFKPRLLSYDEALDAYSAPVVLSTGKRAPEPPGRKEGPLPPQTEAIAKEDDN
jgi:hypothetical protein